jgi:hypothetical protein
MDPKREHGKVNRKHGVGFAIANYQRERVAFDLSN